MNIFFDIETATQFKPTEFKWPLLDIWTSRVAKDDEPIELYKNKWPIYAEYWQVVCVSVGVEKENGKFKLSSVYQNETIDEKALLIKLKSRLDHETMVNGTLVGHNILWFDIPFLAKRFVVNNIEVPRILSVGGMKPWDMNVQDTLVMWKSSWRMGAALVLLCELFGIESPKWDIDWSEVGDAFWNWEYDRIAKYCENDVIATKAVWERLDSLNIYRGQ